MNPADICTTLLLPTRVRAKRPAFSLQGKQINQFHLYKQGVSDCLLLVKNTTEQFQSYTDTDDPLIVPNNPDRRMPTP